ncbi:LPXTG cell wall anchor domain-containing protein [Streptomyces bambusae]|uniref:LPXTG cell wall anchor domain-containing protein n=1 Tax=Streptomyces bambusae TaxID=1550616 RepID=UPI001CFEEACC|nr:LPXTG cell wall anchor domain-containing protein [Streptomyces bambusae]MCB5167917.1 LPXTG cell wall anchor domain-containing protein [Streptomyces bambusae]
MSRNRRAVAALPLAASLFLAAGAAPAAAADTYTVPMHQALPVTATSAGVSHEPKCADIPANQDGWHFVLPGNSTEFVKLTVTFQPGGTQEITVFGPPTEKHAYAASAPGATLTAASAEVEGGSVKWFNLSHTCPATVKPSQSPSATPSGTPSSTPSRTASQTPSGTPSTTASGSASATPSGTVSASTSTEPSSSVSASASASPSGTAATAGSTGGTGGGDLAETGSSTPVGLLAAMAGALITAGAVLVIRRRRTGTEG